VFECPDGSCLASAGKCNGKNECGDLSDEINCRECASVQCYLPTTQSPTCSTVGLIVTERLIAYSDWTLLTHGRSVTSSGSRIPDTLCGRLPAVLQFATLFKTDGSASLHTWHCVLIIETSGRTEQVSPRLRCLLAQFLSWAARDGRLVADSPN